MSDQDDTSSRARMSPGGETSMVANWARRMLAMGEDLDSPVNVIVGDVLATWEPVIDRHATLLVARYGRERACEHGYNVCSRAIDLVLDALSDIGEPATCPDFKGHLLNDLLAELIASAVEVMKRHPGGDNCRAFQLGPAEPA